VTLCLNIILSDVFFPWQDVAKILVTRTAYIAQLTTERNSSNSQLSTMLSKHCLHLGASVSSSVHLHGNAVHQPPFVLRFAFAQQRSVDSGGMIGWDKFERGMRGVRYDMHLRHDITRHR